MPYGTVKVDNITFTNAGSDQTATVSGIVATSNGTFSNDVTAPAFIPTGSSVPTNGVYLPSANNVAISTNGTGRLFVDASGRVGLGVTTPGTTLDLGSGTLRIRNAPGDSNGLQIYQDTSDVSRIYNFYPGPIAFGTNNTERMRLDSSGRLGLGTSSAQSNLDVRGTDAAPSLTVNNGLQVASGNRNYGVVEIGSYNGGLYGWIQGKRPDGNLTSPLAINPLGGNVGIGTTGPTYLLDVQATSGNGIRYKSTTSGFGLYIGDNSGTPFLSTDTASALTFGIQNSEKARIDTSGRLLVGTSSARGYASYGTAGIQNEATSYEKASLGLTNNENSADGVALMLGKTRGASIGSNTVVSSGDVLGKVIFQGADGSALRASAEITAFVDGTPGANDMPGRLVFSVTRDGSASPTEAQRINNAGRAFFYAAGNGLTSASSTGAGTSDALFVGRRSATTTTDGTDVFIVYTNGNVQNTNGSYTTLSDQKLKENIVDASSQWDDLKAIQIRNWNFKEETGHETHRQIGPIAQELEQVCPGLVFETPDRDADGNETGEVTKGINQSVLYMKAVKALQEAMERIEVLEAKVNALEGV